MMSRTSADLTLSTHGIARVASLRFDDLMGLSAPCGSALVLAGDHAAAELAETAQRLCARLFEAVPHTPETSLRRLLVNLQREVFRNRPLKAADVERVRPLLDGAGARLLDDYTKAVDAVASIDREAEEAFAGEMAAARRGLRELLRGEVMQDALVLASVKLLDSINRFYLVRSDLNGKDLDTETGAIKYVSRAAAKTSPFSKFTALTHLVIGGTNEPIDIGNESMALRSSVRLNAHLLFMLLNVLRTDPKVQPHLPLRLNTTLASTGSEHRFLTNWSNVESFQRIAAHPGVDFVIVRLQTPLIWRALQSSIADAFECEADDAAALIERLIALGLVEVDLAVSGLDPDWDLRLAERLAEIAADAPTAAAVMATLRQARHDAEAFANAHGQERVALRSRIAEMFTAITPASAPPPLATSADDDVFEGPVQRLAVPAQMVLYEDATLDLQMRVRRDDAEALVRSSSRLIDAFADFDLTLDERENLESFFAGRYAPGVDVPLLTLYEDFYRHRIQSADAPPIYERTRRRFTRNDERLARLRNILGGRVNGDAVSVDSADLDAAAFPDGSDRRGPASYAAVMQCFVERRGGGEVLCGALSGFGVGFGKLANRFLHLLPAAATDEMREWHERLSRDVIFAEAVDASYFNANIHPPLMPFEISTPGGQTSLPRSRRIKVTDLAVRLGEDGLGLVHIPTGKPTYAFDCGLQRLTGRSKLYQMLSLFGPCGQPTLHPLIAVANKAALAAEEDRRGGVTVWPRIVFDDRIIVQRRRWDVPAALLPARSRGESAWTWFRRVDRWRRGVGLPRHVFARIGLKDPKNLKPANKDDRKPQFIGFDNPLLMPVLEKMLAKVETGLELSEMLPGPEQLLEIGGKRHVTELVFQWYRGLD